MVLQHILDLSVDLQLLVQAELLLRTPHMQIQTGYYLTQVSWEGLESEAARRVA